MKHLNGKMAAYKCSLERDHYSSMKSKTLSSTSSQPVRGYYIRLKHILYLYVKAKAVYSH